MGAPHPPTPVLLLIAASSRYEEALAHGLHQAQSYFGPATVSEAFAFTETNYYDAEMGTGLKKQFWAFENLLDAGQLAAIKLQTNQWEADYAATGLHPEPRPLNLDPGYLTLAKLVLASTKDHAHRIYLADGIYAEVTLQFRSGAWQPLPWTYPDYRRADFQQFFSNCRERLRARN